MALLNALPLPPGIDETTLAGSEVQEIVTTYNIERLQAVNQPVGKNVRCWGQGTTVSPQVGRVKVPIRFLGTQQFSDFRFGGQRDFSTINVGAIEIHTQPKQLNYRWVMVPDTMRGLKLMQVSGEPGSYTYDDFYGATGLASAIVEGGHFHKALLVANVTYQSVTRALDSLAATMLCQIDGIPLFTNGVDTPKHRANPKNPALNAPSFETLFAPGVTNRVGFQGGAFDSVWLGKMILAMTQVPHPSLPNATLELELTDIIGPTWMKIPFWTAAVQNLTLQASMTPSGVAATSNVFSAKVVKEMGADAFIGTAGVAPYTMWTSSLLDNHPYALLHQTDGPGGGPAHFCIGIANMHPGAQSWCEIAANDKEFTPRVKLYGPGDPQAESDRMVRMLGDLDAGAQPGLPHFVVLFLGV